MQKTLLTKLSIIVGLCIIFSIGLSMIGSIIYERQNYAASVIKEITEQHVNPQEVITPFIAIPTTVTPACQSDATDTLNVKRKCEPSYSKTETVFATQTQAAQDLKVNTDTYKRGIYSATSYDGQLTFDQSYTFAETLENLDQIGTTIDDDADSVGTSPNADNTQLAKTITHWNKAKLIIPVSDLRGVATLPTVTINQKSIKANYPQIPMIENLTYVEVDIPKDVLNQLINPTSQQNKEPRVVASSKDTNLDKSGVSSQLPNPKNNQALNIVIDLPLAGISNLTTVPTGQNFTLSMHSDWQTPNFIGKALPNTKSITAEGFDASWQNQYLTVANNQYLSQCISAPNHQCTVMSESTLNIDFESSRGQTADSVTVAGSNQSVLLNSFGVSFASPNDVYLQTERAMKYALLLILVSFGTFFLFEVLKSSRIHPIQYLLVGCALFVFYVLLLPLAEQIVFWKAYAIAASACIGLIGWYSYYVFGGLKRAVIFTATLAGLYAAFFGILSTEDLNLLLGALFCFVILACVMVMTRKLDWYKVT
ncbi:cell envelope integrity protein CreD [Psychrobacter sp. NG254]|uniref:cell envelope integrity protein CreD n=1 Tax=Psychrobacter sp. NG254 TaxID=2782003 RepID=UPI001886FDED|nr:cell envelope integrity protein CreD [Psychrobacter sp. NG254]MBF2719896.1 cell envelope integrity protein CreD [Psychrobacter sp. NG254]